MEINTLIFYTGFRYRVCRAIPTVLCLLVALLPRAQSHPMGNFTINHYSRLTIAPQRLALFWVIDMAELPTISERQAIDTNEDGVITDSEVSAYLKARLPGWLQNLKAESDGKPLFWNVKKASLKFAPGVANLGVMRIQAELAAPVPPGRRKITFSDATYPERPGWKEIVVVSPAGIPAPTGNAPREELSKALSSYPTALLDAPPQISSVDFEASIPALPPPALKLRAASIAAPAKVKPPVESTSVENPIDEFLTLIALLGMDSTAARVDPPVPPRVTRPNIKPEAFVPPHPPAETSPPSTDIPPPPKGDSGSRWSAMFRNLVAPRPLTPPVVLVSLLIASLLGAVHALQPGHGKTLVAAYLVGQRGTARHALLLGLTVTISHTFGVFLLGAVALFGSRYILPERLAPWMGFASGALIALIGGTMLAARIREGATSSHENHHHHHGDEHGSDGHTHSHSHGPHGDHTHDVPDTISIRSLLALGVSGGIVPCWDALIVLLGAVAVHQTLFGMALIVAFSVGLAATLTVAGLAVVWGQNRTALARLTPTRVRTLSIIGNALVLAIGVVLAVKSLAAAGLIAWKG